jgi:hypothetical protein
VDGARLHGRVDNHRLESVLECEGGGLCEADRLEAGEGGVGVGGGGVGGEGRGGRR